METRASSRLHTATTTEERGAGKKIVDIVRFSIKKGESTPIWQHWAMRVIKLT